MSTAIGTTLEKTRETKMKNKSDRSEKIPLYKEETEEQKKIRRELRIKRIKENNEKEKAYENEVVKLYRQNGNQVKKQNEYKDAIQDYSSIMSEIEELKKRKEDIQKEKELNEIRKEQEKASYEQNLQNIQKKKEEFDNFMKDKEQEALYYFRRLEGEKKQKEEDLYKYENKQKTKKEYIDKANKLVDNYKQKEQEKIERAKDNLNEKEKQENSLNILYKVTAPFHNNGCKIDYSTTNFHNIVVFKHDDNIEEYMKKNNAFARANEEYDKMIKRNKSKEKELEDFNNNMQKNYDEILRQARAEENLKRLNEELNKIAHAKKKNNNNRANINCNINNAKQLDKKSEYIFNNLLNKQEGKRTKLLSKQVKPIGDDQISQANDESMRNFYEDDKEDEKDQAYYEKAMKEHNEEIERALKNKQFNYEEPIAREAYHPIKEKIKNVNPIDIESYQKSIYEDNIHVKHGESAYPKVNFDRIKSGKNPYKIGMNTSTMELGNESVMENTTFSILDAFNINSTIIGDRKKNSDLSYANISNNNINGNNQNNKKNSSNAVNEFISKVNSQNVEKPANPSPMKNRNILLQIDEKILEENYSNKNSYKNIRKPNNNIIDDNQNINNNPKTNNIASNKTVGSSNNLDFKPKEDLFGIYKNNIVDNLNFNSPQFGNKDSSLNLNDINNNEIISGNNNSSSGNIDINNNNNKNEIINNVEFKPDSSKWKLSKEELFERRQKMLKDKSVINKK